MTIRQDSEPRPPLRCRTLTLRADTIDREERSVEAVLATENRVLAFDLGKWETIEEVLLMDGCELPEQIILCDSHPQRWGSITSREVRGSVREMRVEKGQLIGTLRFATDEASEELWTKVRDGHITDVSVGSLPLEQLEIAPDQTKKINNRAYTAGKRPLFITTRWKPRELSVTPFGADQQAKIRQDTTWENDAMNERLRAYLESIGLGKDASESDAWAYFHKLEGGQRTRAATLFADPEAAAEDDEAPAPPKGERTRSEEQPPRGDRPTDPPPRRQSADEPVDQARVRAEERERIERIRELAGADVPAEMVTRAISEDWTVDRAGTAFLEAIRDARAPGVPNGSPAIHSRSHERDCTTEALGAGMMIRAGLDPVAQHVRYESGVLIPRREGANTEHLEQAAERGHGYAGMSLIDVCREAIRLDGGTVRSAYNREEIIRTAMSGGSLTNIFTTTFSAQLLSSYGSMEDTTMGWTREADVPNFQTNERTQMGKMGRLKKHTRGGEAHHMSNSDKKEEYKLARYSGQFVVDEMDIIDDRFGAIEQTSPEEMGEAARELRPELVYAILLANGDLSDGIALFEASTHGNLRTSAALAAATLKQAINDLNTMTQNGRTLSKSGPMYLIVPEALSFTADQLINSAEVRDTTSSTLYGTKNPLQSRQLIAVSDGRLDNGVTDPNTGTAYSGSATTWFMARAAGRHTIEVGFRRGTARAPTIRSSVLTQGQWGIGFDVNMDIGAKSLDYRGLHKNTN